MTEAERVQRGLMLFAHGSKDSNWCRPFEMLVNQLQEAIPQVMVRLAYMEFVEPTLSQVTEEFASSGVTLVRVLPLFLSVGAHVSEDIPLQIKNAQSAHPSVKLELLPPAGEDPRLFSLMREIAIEAAAGACVPGALDVAEA